MTGMIVAIAADHNGVELKYRLKSQINALGHHCIDVGPFKTAPPVDYVDYAQLVGTMIQAGDCDRGVLICGTGIGMSIAANKIPAVRAALVHNFASAAKSREHNDANVLCLGSWVCSDDENFEISRTWLDGKFGEYRHVRRVERIAPEPAGKLVFANGVFDILHKGHIEMLRWASNLGDRLVVGINSDASTRALKGASRPINNQENRKALLEALRFVDEVLIFDELTPTALVEKLRPKIVVKGGEWLASEVRERDKVPPDVEVKIYPLVQGYSSTNVITAIRSL